MKKQKNREKTGKSKNNRKIERKTEKSKKNRKIGKKKKIVVVGKYLHLAKTSDTIEWC